MGLSKKNRYVYCADCGCRLEMNGVCKICGHTDVPPLPGMVPNIVGLTQEAATTLLTGPEAQLKVGTIEEANDATVPAGLVISSEPVADTQLKIHDPVNIVVSLGPAE